VYGGLTEVTLDAMTMAQPHSHNAGTEEVWIALEGDIRFEFGKQFRNLPVGSAYRIPSDGITVHANMNSTGKPIRLIHMMKSAPGETRPYSQLNPKQFDPATDPCIDLFMGHWKDSMPRSLYGSLVVRDILTRCDGDPLHPARKGAVLTDLVSVSYATLYPHAATALSTLAGEQQVFYINSGSGTIRAGKQTAELRGGIGVLMPAGLEFAMTNTGGEPLTMYLVTEPLAPGFKPEKDMMVSDANARGLSMSVHWSNLDRGLFWKSGLSTLLGIGPVMLDAMTIAQPHSHEKGVEEVWIALDGDIRVLLGKQLRALPVGAAYKVPADGITAHANINQTDRPVNLMWMMRVPEK
jgi:mannose-6-phosphate isomerase-like protein (cupin superfamily)